MTGSFGVVEHFVRRKANHLTVGVGLGVRAGAGDPVSTGGTWEIIQGGTWGDVIEIVIRDVTFDGLIGHDFVMESMHWRVRLPSSPIVHPGSSDGGPPPSDGGGVG